jgi:hypothetical protein
MNSIVDKEIIISADKVLLSDYTGILMNSKSVRIDPDQIEKVTKSHTFLKEFLQNSSVDLNKL